MRIDVVSIFPDYLAPLDLSLIGKARRRRPARPAGARPAGLHPRPAPHRRRHALRRRGRHGDEAQPWAEALDHVLAREPEGAAAPPHLIVPGPGGRRSRRPWPASSRPSPGSPSRAGATRASTSASTTMPGSTSGLEVSSSAWATTSSTAARWPSSPWWRRSPASCPASSATPSRSSRSRTRTACSSTPSTPSPGCGAGAACPSPPLGEPRRHRPLAARPAPRAHRARRPDMIAALDEEDLDALTERCWLGQGWARGPRRRGLAWASPTSAQSTSPQSIRAACRSWGSRRRAQISRSASPAVIVWAAMIAKRTSTWAVAAWTACRRPA